MLGSTRNAASIEDQWEVLGDQSNCVHSASFIVIMVVLVMWL